MAASGSPTSIVPTTEEAEKIAKVREALSAELGKLEAEGKAFPHTTGDIFFLRLVRGNDSVEDCVKWFKNCLEYRAKFGLDEIYKSVEGKKWKLENIPHAKELTEKYVTHVFDEDDHRTASGDLFWYESWGDRKLKEMMDDVPEAKLREFVLTLMELRWYRLDVLSRETNRMVKITLVIDLEGASFGGLEPRYGKFEKEVGQAAVIHTSIEALTVLYFLDFPSWAKTIYRVATAVFPKRMVEKFRVLGTDWQSNPDLVSDLGAGRLAKCRPLRKCKFPDNTSMQGEGRVIGAGAIMERVIEVTPGCQVLWNFKIGSSADAEAGEAASGLLGKALDSAAGEATDILFQVRFMPNLDSVMEIDGIKPGDVVVWEDHCVDVVPPTTVDSSMGQLDGKTVCDRNGLITVAWNNSASWVRGRVIANFNLVVNRPEDDVGSFHSGDD